VFQAFVDSQLAQIDNLDELKVTLVALRLLEQKQNEMASVSEADLLVHPAIRGGLRFPSITLRPALQLAVARGTLLQAQAGNAVRYFRNDPAGQRASSAFERAYAKAPPPDAPAERVLNGAGREIERLEGIDFYPPASDDLARVEEWLARGYSSDDVLEAVRATLLHPRAKGTSHRTLTDCQKALYRKPPAAPSDYYAVCVARTRKPPEEIVNLRLRLGREPDHHEFAALRDAVGLFGLRAALDGLRRLSGANDASRSVDLAALVPLLAESESAAISQSRADDAGNAAAREAIQLYESSFGTPPTGLIADEIKSALNDVPDLALWRAVFEYAARQNKKSWAYVRKLLLNPSPDLFAPAPVNELATAAFEMYRRRVNRVIDATIATEINTLAGTVSELARWTNAFDKAAAANALRWDYIKSVLTSSTDKKTDGKRQPARKPQQRGGGTYRRTQVEYSDEQRKAAEERARRELDEETDE
jgi:hypothetical protein